VIGSIRREYLDHVNVFSEAALYLTAAPRSFGLPAQVVFTTDQMELTKRTGAANKTKAVLQETLAQTLRAVNGILCVPGRFWRDEFPLCSAPAGGSVAKANGDSSPEALKKQVDRLTGAIVMRASVPCRLDARWLTENKAKFVAKIALINDKHSSTIATQSRPRHYASNEIAGANMYMPMDWSGDKQRPELQAIARKAYRIPGGLTPCEKLTTITQGQCRTDRPAREIPRSALQCFRTISQHPISATLARSLTI
jgi:hypothetical protein